MVKTNHEKLRIGVIGTGAMGRNHLRVIHSLPGLSLTAAADSDPLQLEQACSGYSLFKSSDFRHITDRVDAVMVSAPTLSHFEIAEFFICQGKHVLLEKPVTTTVDQADQLIRLAADHNVELAVGHLERFNPAVEWIESRISRPLFIEAQRLGQFSPRSLDVDVIMDLMIHDLDIILHWDPSDIKDIHASGVPIISEKIDIANARLEFESGLVANVTASRVSQKKTRKLRIFQKNRYFSLDYKKKTVKTYGIESGIINEEIPQINEVEPLKNLWENFRRTLITNSNYNVTAPQARRALEVAIRISDHIKHKLVR